jgi:hypothetical protein
VAVRSGERVDAVGLGVDEHVVVPLGARLMLRQYEPREGQRGLDDQGVRPRIALARDRKDRAGRVGAAGDDFGCS